MTLIQPFFLILLIPLGVAYFLTRPATRPMQFLRAAVLLLVVLAIAGLAIKFKSRQGVLVVVADRSKSMPAGSDTKIKEIIDIVQKDSHRNNRLAVVSFAQESIVDHAPQQGIFGGFAGEVDRDASNLANAMELAMSCIPENTPGRILLISDGKYTGIEPMTVASRLALRSVPVDYRLLERPGSQDTSVYRVDTPSQVYAGEAFYINAWVQSPLAQEVKFVLRRGSDVLTAGSQKVDAGLTRLSFRDLIKEPGTAAYTISITPAGTDATTENNIARTLVGVEGKRKVLCVSENGAELSRMLKENGVENALQKPSAVFWTIDELARYCAVILDNVPAGKIGNMGMETLAQWVRQSGSGLMLTGGKQSYGPGGYFKSPLEEIMPVSMELRQEHRKFSTAIVVVMDRSGSMAVPVGSKTKMDLANISAVQVLDLLSDMDEFGVIAVDSIAHTVLPISSVSKASTRRSDILSVQSMGGGIFIYEALSAAAQMVAESQSQNRHIILFADAADSEEPGDYKNLLAKCVEAGITVSVIGLGTPADVDAALLQEIAFLGKGQIYFTQDAMELPRLFAQDTFVVARNTFVKEVTKLESTPGLIGIAGKMYEMPEPVGGYNLCYLRPGANLGAQTIDDYKAPIVAAWQAGVGRVLCLAIPVADEHTGAIAKWGGYSPFIASLARWTAGQDAATDQDYVFTQEIDNGVCRLQMHLDPDRVKQISTLPQVNILRGTSGQKPTSEKRSLFFKDADTLELKLPLKGSETLLASVVCGGLSPHQLTPVCLPYSPEFSPASLGSGEETLTKIARITQGKQRIDLGQIWSDMPRKPRVYSMTPWLLLAAICVLLVEVFERRTGVIAAGTMKLPIFRREPKSKIHVTSKKNKKEQTRIETSPEPAKTVQPQTPAPKPVLESALSAAKKKADQYLGKN